MSTLAKIDFTFRVVILLLAMTVGVFFIIVGARNALAANLKPAAIISSDTFTVGDIFSGLPAETAAKVLGPAPLPGKDMVLNARTLLRIAIALELPWRPSSSTDHITIRRAASVIESEMIHYLVTTGLEQAGVNDRFEITFLNAEKPQMIVPAQDITEAAIKDIAYDPQTGRFTVSLVSPSLANPLAQIDLAGRVDRLVDVPVLKKAMAKGDVIDAYAVEWVEIRSSELQPDTILKEENIIGMTPRRIMAAGKPVRAGELERPMLVSRGDTITISYNAGPITLTTKGRAMQDGAKGDLIRVINTSSNRPVEAFVDDRQLVTVSQ